MMQRNILREHDARTCLTWAVWCVLAALLPGSISSQTFSDMTEQNAFNVTGQNRGIAIGDFNNDGLEDIYVSRMWGANLLYKNLGNFQFAEVSEEYGVRNTSSTNASLWFDMDNDGDLDLFLANLFQSNVLYRNDGNVFTDITNDMGVGSVGNMKTLHAVDYDNDGDLDLYITVMLDQNILWRNESGQGFTDVTAEAGIDDSGRSLGAIFFDYDLDGDQDMYQTRDGDDPNLFYQNNGNGTFSEVSADLGLNYVGFGMGTDIADINHNGRPDIYLTNLYENKLYISNTSGSFDEVSLTAGVDDIGMGWSTFFFDCNNNGLADIYLANDSHFGVNGQTDTRNRLFLNNGNLNFHSQDFTGNVQNIHASYGAACADFNNDGKLDIAIANSGNDGGNQLFMNSSIDRSYLRLRLRGTESNYYGIGSRVELYHSGESKVEFVYAGSGYASQSSSVVHFGLGDLTAVDSVVIYWPSGIRQVILNPQVNELHVIEETDVIIVEGLVVWTEPAFPIVQDDVTIFFNAQEGNGALAGFTGDVFAHTGVITSQSSNGNDWKHVIGNWGTFDSRVLMTRIEDDIYTLSYNIEDYYDIPPGEEVLKMAFVFRNVNGTIVGRNSDGSDIFTDVFPSQDGLFLTLLAPIDDNLIREDDSLLIQFEINSVTNVVVADNEEIVFSDSTDNAAFYLHPASEAQHNVTITATTSSDTTEVDFKYFVVANEATIEDPPLGVRNGLNYMGDTSYVFQLYAPDKEFVFFLCPENDYQLDPGFRMNMSVDGSRFWIELPKSNFEAGGNAYLYSVDDFIIIADPYAELVLDPNQDPFLSGEAIENLPDHPGSPYQIVTVFDLDDNQYDWNSPDFDKPEKSKLVIYELLIRDFLQDHNYTSLLDTLDYLERLGINAIELMPIQEFEGNISWGYNPSFHMAVDKYYGSRDQLRMFIDEAHNRGIAVILDVVFNHAFSQSPLAQLYWDNANFRPSPDNPWLNVTARHPFNVGYDFNHESPATKEWVKRNLERWITDFHFDGFRFDLSKGLTQTNSGNNAGLMAQFDASRIAILQDYADHIWSMDSTSYVILEHFADNSEETVLSDYGMMLWGNMSFEFAQAAMGYSSDLEGADYTVRGWDNPQLIAYMESHDEERLMYKILQFGDNAPDYNTRELSTALKRVAAVSTIYYMIPGPKMMWQFGELGYDFSINRCVNGTINDNCRLDSKPIRWDYLLQQERDRLREVISSILHLRTQYPTFSSTDFNFNDGNFFLKTVHFNHPDMDAVVLANFRVINSDLNAKFQYPGTWYEYFTGDSLEVVDVNEKLPLQPGDYRIYTSKRIVPPNGFFTRTQDLNAARPLAIWPNPIRKSDEIVIQWEQRETVRTVTLTTMSGKSIAVEAQQSEGFIYLKIPSALPEGVYIVQVQTEGAHYVGKVVFVKF